MKSEKRGFEESLKLLDEIVQKLENPEIALQEGFVLYQEGMKLAGEMRKELDEIEKKVKILQRDESGKMEETEFGDAGDD